jgi:hypothetical protein
LLIPSISFIESFFPILVRQKIRITKGERIINIRKYKILIKAIILRKIIATEYKIIPNPSKMSLIKALRGWLYAIVQTSFSSKILVPINTRGPTNESAVGNKRSIRFSIVRWEVKG